MIIVSQDKRIIHNFNNVNCIIIRKVEEIYCIILFDNTYDMKGDGDYIGIYKTEERAKEVLRSIVATYQANKIFECADRIEQNQTIEKFLEEKMLPFAYEMPEE